MPLLPSLRREERFNLPEKVQHGDAGTWTSSADELLAPPACRGPVLAPRED